ncbi:MAG: hypothetical protein IIZ66_03310, partial [Clostridia bacterium]|nr:hypothetical protein [Clostridia bacterium]
SAFTFDRAVRVTLIRIIKVDEAVLGKICSEKPFCVQLPLPHDKKTAEKRGGFCLYIDIGGAAA